MSPTELMLESTGSALGPMPEGGGQKGEWGSRERERETESGEGHRDGKGEYWWGFISKNTFLFIGHVLLIVCCYPLNVIRDTDHKVMM